MSHRTLAAVVTSIAFGYLAPVAVLAQSQGVADSRSTWTQPRTPAGHPDVQGSWTMQTFTPLERPDMPRFFERARLAVPK